MKKISLRLKKTLLFIGSISFAGSGIIASVYLGTSKNDYSVSSEIDYNYAKLQVGDFMNNLDENVLSLNNDAELKKKINNLSIKHAETLDSSKVVWSSPKSDDNLLSYIQSVSNDLLEHFQTQNFSVSDIQLYLSSNNENYADVINNPDSYINVTKDNSFTSVIKSHVSSSQMTNEVHNLRMARSSFATISAGAAVASAAFWAAAWWFGLSIPWAINAAIVSATCGTAAAGLGIALVAADKDMSDWSRFGTAFSSTINLGHALVRILWPILIGTTVTLTATSWAFPAVWAIIPVVGAIIAFLEALKN